NELDSILLVHSETGKEECVKAKALCVYIGAKPVTDWLPEDVFKDDKGFVLTGSDLLKEKKFAQYWKLAREPYPSETSMPGLFASGDVRFGALAGISSAVGEGALTIRYVRKYLSEN